MSVRTVSFPSRRAVEGADLFGIESRLRDSGQSDSVVGAACGLDRRDALILGRLRDVVGDQIFGAIAEEPSRLTPFVALERAAVEHVGGWIGCLAIDSRGPQRRRIADELVPDAMEDHRIVGRDGVEVVTGGVAPFGEQTLVPAAADHPFLFRRPTNSRRHALHDLGHGAGVVELNFAQHAPGRLQVIVGIDQTRHDRLPAQILDSRRWTSESANLIVAADGDEPPVADGNGGCAGIPVIDRVDDRVDEDQIRSERSGRAGHSSLL